MRDNMCRKDFESGSRGNYHQNEDWCDGYEQGWKDCKEKMMQQSDGNRYYR